MRLLRSAAVVLCLLGLAGTTAFGAERQTDGTTPAPAPAPVPTVNTAQLMVPGPLGEKTLGDPKAPVTVIEYVSMTCPHCARFANETFDAFKTKYIDTGKVFYVLREYPLDQLALVAIMAARCAPDDKFFPLIAQLFRDQNKWAFVENPGPALLSELQQVGITEAAFKECIANDKLVEGVIGVEKQANETFGVKGTPTFFFNGVAHTGEMTIAEVDALVEPLLQPKTP
jgi:protein-disulfide isomerase